jgi:Phospholipase_D-nuclease N-terminal
MAHQFTSTEIALIVALGVIEFGLLAAAWIVLFRTPTARLTLPKWAWAVICVVQFIGPIAFFAVGRKPQQVADTAPHPDGASTTTRVVDDLYGDR